MAHISVNKSMLSCGILIWEVLIRPVEDAPIHVYSCDVMVLTFNFPAIFENFDFLAKLNKRNYLPTQSIERHRSHLLLMRNGTCAPALDILNGFVKN